MVKNFSHPCPHVDYIKNVKLEERFLAQKEKLLLEGRDAGEVLLWHGTNPGAVEPILKNNFDIESVPVQAQGRDKKMQYGRGIYFSEVPTSSLLYKNDNIFIKAPPSLPCTIMIIIQIQGSDDLPHVRQQPDPLQGGFGLLSKLRTCDRTQSFELSEVITQSKIGNHN